MKKTALIILLGCAASTNWMAAAPLAEADKTSKASPPESRPEGAVDQLIPWLLDESRQLRGIRFAEVIFDTTGKRVLPVDPKNEVDQRVVKSISAACDETVRRLNVPDSAIQSTTRINEVSSHFEDVLRELLNAEPGLSCDLPRTAQGRVMRSGYPDLRIVDLASKRVFYLDPKLYAVGSRDSSFRSFYFEPKIATTRCVMMLSISSPALSTNRERKVIGSLRAGTLSILPSLE
jgi:hypothetical protein